MSDIFTTGIKRLAPGDVAGCKRFRLPIRFVDSETQQIEEANFSEGSSRGRVMLAVKTNAKFASPAEEAAFWESVMMQLAQMRKANGDA